MKINNLPFNNIQPQYPEAGQKVDYMGVKYSQPKKIISYVNELLSWRENGKSENRCPKWELSRIPLKYFIDNLNENDRFLPEFTDAVQSAFLPWSRASAGLIRFERVYNKDIANIIIGWTDIITAGRPFEAGHTDLKVFNYKIDKAEVEIVIFPVIDQLTNSEQRIERVRRTALHEIGHSLGLNHSTGKKDIMYHRGINNKILSSNDINRLMDLYNSSRPESKFY